MAQAAPDEKSAGDGADPSKMQDLGIIQPAPTVALFEDIFERGECSRQQPETENVKVAQERGIRVIHTP